MRTPWQRCRSASDFLVFWQENSEPRMGRVGRDGSVATLGGSAIALPADGIARTLVGAVAVTGGALVMVSENSLTKVMKVDATGAALSALSDAAGPASTFQSGIASSGGSALGAGRRPRHGPTGHGIRATGGRGRCLDRLCTVRGPRRRRRGRAGGRGLEWQAATCAHVGLDRDPVRRGLDPGKRRDGHFRWLLAGRGSPLRAGSETSVPSDIATSTPDAGGANKGAMDDLRAPALVWTDAGGVLFYRRLDTART